MTPHKPARRLFCPLLLGLALTCALGTPKAGAQNNLASPTAKAQGNLVTNPGFEDGEGGWRLFVPPESADKGCAFEFSTLSPHSGARCLAMRSSGPARYAACVKTMRDMPIRFGERARLTFWVRAGADLLTTSKPAFVVRMFLSDDAGQPIPGNLALYVGLNGMTTFQTAGAALDLNALDDKKLAPTWQKVEAVFEIPKEINTARQFNAPEFFVQNAAGSIFLDDVSLERVGPDVPLSPSFKRP